MKNRCLKVTLPHVRNSGKQQNLGICERIRSIAFVLNAGLKNFVPRPLALNRDFCRKACVYTHNFLKVVWGSIWTAKTIKFWALFKNVCVLPSNLKSRFFQFFHYTLVNKELFFYGLRCKLTKLSEGLAIGDFFVKVSYIFLEVHNTRGCKRRVFQNARVLPSKLMRHPTFERKVMGRRCSNLGFKAKAIRPMPFRSGSLSSKLASWLARAAMVCPAPFGLKV